MILHQARRSFLLLFIGCGFSRRMDDEPAIVTKKLWSLVPIGAAWTESMTLGARLHEQARDEFFADIEQKNMALAQELSICSLQLSTARNTIANLQARPHFRDFFKPSRDLNARFVLQDSNEKLRQELSYYQRLSLEQNQATLSASIWGRKEEDNKPPEVIWNCAALLINDQAALYSLSPPLTISKVVSDMGLQLSPSQMHRLSILVHQAYMREHGVAPKPRIHYDCDGTPERISCYTEAERALITTVVADNHQQFTGDSLIINPPC